MMALCGIIRSLAVAVKKHRRSPDSGGGGARQRVGVLYPRGFDYHHNRLVTGAETPMPDTNKGHKHAR